MFLGSTNDEGIISSHTNADGNVGTLGLFYGAAVHSNADGDVGRNYYAAAFSDSSIPRLSKAELCQRVLQSYV